MPWYYLYFRNPVSILSYLRKELRIDNSRQSVICATLHCSLSPISTISYHISNDSLYFCLSNHINNIMINIIFRKL